MKKLLIFIIVQLLVQATLFAQTTTEDRILIETLGPERFSELVSQRSLQSKALIHQAGNTQDATINQATGGSRPNIAIISQVGAINQATLTQQGQGNQTMVSQQGARNTYNGYISGYNNTTGIVQDGSGNKINQVIVGSDLEHTLVQQGNNNTINQIESTFNSRSYTVVQQGNNMNITIEQSNWGVPVTISATKK